VEKEDDKCNCLSENRSLGAKVIEQCKEFCVMTLRKFGGDIEDKEEEKLLEVIEVLS
jgi:hypothetical protein